MSKEAEQRMTLCTPVDIPEPLRPWDVADRFVFLGSCFAHHMGSRLGDAHLTCTVNPLGALYSPASLCASLSGDIPLTKASCVSGPQGWHSWSTDTTFSRDSADEALKAARQATKALNDSVETCTQLVLTLGTSHCYRLAADGRIVANCHKHPAREFCEEAQSVEQIVVQMESAVKELLKRNGQLVVTLTVSPYRYAKYGLHESQLSKATLLLACEELRHRFPNRVQYFPAYEIVLDELRDYRFYDADMLHPSPVATDYIFEKLFRWMSPALQQYLHRWKPIAQALRHRPIHPASADHRAFVEQTRRKVEQLQRDYPMLTIKPEF